MPTDKVRLAMDAHGNSVQGALHPRLGGSQIVAIGAVATRTSELVDAEVVRLIATADCHIRFGGFDAVAAIAADMLLKANMAEYFTLRGTRWVSVIQDAGGGNLYVQIMD